jgi:hypothetical protein
MYHPNVSFVIASVTFDTAKEAARTRSLAAAGIDDLPIPLTGAGIDSLIDTLLA